MPSHHCDTTTPGPRPTGYRILMGPGGPGGYKEVVIRCRRPAQPVESFRSELSFQHVFPFECSFRTSRPNPPSSRLGMPRPRVRPENRQRSARACEPCKIAKKRCDSALPCGTCVKKSIAPSCEYARSHGRGSSHWRSAGGDFGSAAPRAPSSEPRRGAGAGGSQRVEGTSSISPGPPTPQSSRMPTGQSPLIMLSSSGENGMACSHENSGVD